jgi:hypothetical protein
MEKDIVDGKIGEVGAYDLEFKNGKLSFKVSALKSGVSVSALVEAEADAVIDAMAKAIPGQIDDAVFGLIKAALKV